MSSLSDGIINTYKGLLDQSSVSKEHCLNQQRALQLIFDVKFLRMIIPRKDDSLVRYLMLLIANELCIDHCELNIVCGLRIESCYFLCVEYLLIELFRNR